MSAAAPRPRCPSCHGPLRRVHRRPEDHDPALGAGLRRFRCRDAGCGWEGLLARPHRQPESSRRLRRRAVDGASLAAPRQERIATALLLVLTAALVTAIVWLRDLAPG